MKARMNLLRGALALLCGCALSAPMAAVVVNGTRVVVDAATGEATVQLRNVGNQPVLVQAWIDQGDASAAPTKAGSPFVLTPPVARIEPGQAQALRLIRAAEIAQDARESLYWLNVVEVPPKPNARSNANGKPNANGNPNANPKTSPAASDNMLLFSLRTRIKLFYRPQALAGSAHLAHERLCFNYEPVSGQLRVGNPTPFHITFGALLVQRADGSVAGAWNAREDGMVAPGSARRFSVPAAGAAAPLGVSYTVINDQGGATVGQRKSAALCQAEKVAS